MTELYIYGGGGHTSEILPFLPYGFDVKGIINDYESGFLCGYPVVGGTKDLVKLHKFCKHIIIGVGMLDNHKGRGELYNALIKIGYFVWGFTHPSAQVYGDIRKGTQIFANAYIGTGAEIGENCIINTGAIVSHDCKLGFNVHICPGAILAGGVKIGDNCIIGMGATVYMGLEIPEGTIIKNGQHVYGN